MIRDEFFRLGAQLFDLRDKAEARPHEPQDKLVEVRERLHAEVEKRKNEQ